MKKFLIICLCGLVIYFTWDILYYRLGVITPKIVEEYAIAKNDGKEIMVKKGDEYVPFEIKGVNLSSGIPGHFSTDFAISKQDYLRYFDMITAMGANTIRIYTILSDDFYNAFFEYNNGRAEPLYLIHGLWINDYIQNSYRDAFNPDFKDTFLEDAETLVDVIHGKKKLSLGEGVGSGVFDKDISSWVLGYIVGAEFVDMTVAFTDNKLPKNNSYVGQYITTTAQASPFEAMLAEVMDKIATYENTKYGVARLMAFCNYTSTDPFTYTLEYYKKIATLDASHIVKTEKFKGGMFASYHVYPFHQNYVETETSTGNSYRDYLKRLNDYHDIPVVISEFGIPSSRGMAQKDLNAGRSDGFISEKQQAVAITKSYDDIEAAGCAGAIVFSFQDEWFKRSWNTIHAVDRLKTPYWSDYQTEAQSFGLLAFDPGKEKSVCYVDGDLAEWTTKDMVSSQDGMDIYVKYDEKFMYFMVKKDKLSIADKLYIPIDLTPKSGSLTARSPQLTADRPMDFIIQIDGENNSRVFVEERYEVLRAMYLHETARLDAYEKPPAVDTPKFKTIRLVTDIAPAVDGNYLEALMQNAYLLNTYETGKLLMGNGNPESPNYNSLADFCFGTDAVEIKLPWQLLNFYDPSEMVIHDDYYLHYGVEGLRINKMYVGAVLSEGHKTAKMTAVKLKGWGKSPTYHERLKPAYFALQKRWSD